MKSKKRQDGEKIREQIIELLKNFPHLRDSDTKLVANIWHNRLPSNIKSAFSLLQYMANGNLINYDSITRERRLIQKDYPELRGVYYKKNKIKSITVKNSINGKN